MTKWLIVHEDSKTTIYLKESTRNEHTPICWQIDKPWCKDGCYLETDRGAYLQIPIIENEVIVGYEEKLVHISWKHWWKIQVKIEQED